MKTTLLPYSNNVDSDATCADSSLLSKAVSERSSTHKNVIPEKMAAEIQKKKNNCAIFCHMVLYPR